MASQFGTVGICSIGIGVVFVDNLVSGKDPFPALIAGGVFTGGCVIASEADPEFGEAIAWVFLLANLLLKSDAIINVLTAISGTKAVKVNTTSPYTNTVPREPQARTYKGIQA